MNDTDFAGILVKVAVLVEALMSAQEELPTCEGDCGCEGSNPACGAWQQAEDALADWASMTATLSAR